MIPFASKFVSKSYAQRTIWIKRFFFIILFFIFIRAAYLQIIKKSDLVARADHQHSQTLSIKLQRGPIYDSGGNILAVSLPLDSIFTIPSEVEDPQKTAKQLSRILNTDYQTLIKKLTAKASFIWLKRNPKPEISERIKKEKLNGIYSLTEYQRFYPLKNHASQLIGFSGIDSQGLEGLEYQYDSHLMDSSSRHSVWKSLYNPEKVNQLSGGSLELTINSKLQYFTEEELKKAVFSAQAKKAIGIVMESQTGRILAIANFPDYDPNNFKIFNQSAYFNNAVSMTYEPGSTFKVITIASALENNIVNKNDFFFCENGEYQIQDRVIHDVAKYGWLSLEKIIKKSSNICAAKIGQRIPKPLFYKMIHEFGFGSKTGVSLPGEQNGTVHNYQSWSDTDVATISYGHSISATPIQVITAINTIATGGILVTPTVINQAKNANNQIVQLTDKKAKRILKKEVADIVKGFMVSVTQPGGTGVRARIKGINIAAKSGTSRKFDRRLKKYSSKSHWVSFVGFFPAEKPRLTVLVVVDDPQKKYMGTKSAAPIFKKISEHAIHLYPKKFPLDLKKFDPAKNTISVFRDLKSKNDQKGASADSKQVKSITAKLRNKTFREVLAIADKENIKVTVKGSGIARSIRKNKSSKNHYIVTLR